MYADKTFVPKITSKLELSAEKAGVTLLDRTAESILKRKEELRQLDRKEERGKKTEAQRLNKVPIEKERDIKQLSSRPKSAYTSSVRHEPILNQSKIQTINEVESAPKSSVRPKSAASSKQRKISEKFNMLLNFTGA